MTDDQAERTKRALVAAGRFDSGLPDVSERHDDYLADDGRSGSFRDDLLARLDAVERRLDRMVATPTPGLTDPDEATGERWEAGQAWAHIAEFVPYWLAEAERVAAGGRRPGAPDAVPFGRTKSDLGRVAAIERDRREDPRALLGRARDAIARVRAFTAGLTPEAWSSVGLHPTRGERDVGYILEDFVVAHLEEHADQLEGLAEAPGRHGSPVGPADR